MSTVKSNGIIREIKSRKEEIDRQSKFLYKTVHGINLSLHEDEIPLKIIVVPYDGDENFIHLTEEDKKRILEIPKYLEKRELRKLKTFIP